MSTPTNHRKGSPPESGNRKSRWEARKSTLRLYHEGCTEQNPHDDSSTVERPRPPEHDVKRTPTPTNHRKGSPPESGNRKSRWEARKSTLRLYHEGCTEQNPHDDSSTVETPRPPEHDVKRTSTPTNNRKGSPTESDNRKSRWEARKLGSTKCCKIQ